jgi:hypothetical protein
MPADIDKPTSTHGLLVHATAVCTDHLISCSHFSLLHLLLVQAKAAAGTAGSPVPAVAAETTAGMANRLKKKAESKLRTQHHLELTLERPGIARLLHPSHASTAAATAAAPQLAAAAAVVDVAARKQNREVYVALGVQLPRQQEQQPDQQQQEEEQQEPTESEDDEADQEELLNQLLTGASWHDNVPAARVSHMSQAAAAAAVAAAALASAHPGCILSRFGALPLRQAAPPANEMHPEQAQRPALQPQLQRQMATAAVAVQAGLSGMVFGAVPRPAACKSCLSLLHIGRGKKTSKCPVHGLQQHSAAEAAEVDTQLQQQQQQGRRRRQQQQQQGAEGDWMAALGPDGVQLVGALRHMADHVLQPELDALRNQYKERVPRQQKRQAAQQQQQQQQEQPGEQPRQQLDRRRQRKRRPQGGRVRNHGWSTDGKCAAAVGAGEEDLAVGAAGAFDSSSDGSDGDGTGASDGGRAMRRRGRRKAGQLFAGAAQPSGQQGGRGGSRQGGAQVRKRRLAGAAGPSAAAAGSAGWTSSNPAAGDDSKSQSSAGGSSGSSSSSSSSIDSECCAAAQGAGDEGVAAGSKLGLDPWSFIAAAVLLQEMAKDAAGMSSTAV